MMFRRLYWVTEQRGPDGWRATGVYTSCSDLVEKGFRWIGTGGSAVAFRLTLAKLDSSGDVFGTWAGPEFRGLATDLDLFVKTGEFTPDDCHLVKEAAARFAGAAVR